MKEKVPEIVPPRINLIPLPREITEEMQKSYIDYAMSVIVDRALPDVRDGLKPVHRRILYTMNETGLGASAKYRKSASVVGDVLGKYHPHGDSAVYESLVRMAQDFSMRYMLIDGQGNFGSVDGDSAAAMRYTECRMTKMAEELLADIEKETVDFRDNYDGRLKEPVVLPAKVPNLLLNGIMGIAVGMATNIPPHNLGELMDALVYLIHHPEATVDDLMQYVKGPDFPTKGMIYDVEAIKTAYATGRGSVIMRARATIEELKNGKQAIIVTELPYQVNKAVLIEKIADLVRDKKLVGITDLRDESDRHGIRIVIELKKDAFPNKLLNQLYQMTAMQSSFGFNMMALVDGIQPQLLDLKGILEHFILHREVVVTRRTQYELKVAQNRAHILEGLKKALDHIDEIILTIKKSEDKDTAKVNLIKKFEFTDIQAEAILEMKLRTLAGLERKKIEDELKEKLALIKELQSILGDKKKLFAIIEKEFEDIKTAYGDERRTEVIPYPLGKFNVTDMIPNEDMIVTITRENYIKRISPSSYRVQHRGGKGIVAMTTKEEDEIAQILSTKNHNELLFFTSKGRVFKLHVYDIPQASRQAKGQAIVNLLDLQEDEKVITTVDTTQFKGKYLVIATAKGQIKKTAFEEFKNIRSSGIIAIKLRPGDELLRAKQSSGEDEIIMVTKQGQSIRFSEKDVRPMGRAASGVRGIRLKGNDMVVKMDIIKSKDSYVYILTEKGLGKKTYIDEYRLQNRGGSGIKAMLLTKKTGNIVGVSILEKGQMGDFLVVSKQGQMIRIRMGDIPIRGRVTQGVFVMRMSGNDSVANMSFIKKTDDSEAREEDRKELQESHQEEPMEEEFEKEEKEVPVKAKKEVKTIEVKKEKKVEPPKEVKKVLPIKKEEKKKEVKIVFPIKKEKPLKTAKQEPLNLFSMKPIKAVKTKKEAPKKKAFVAKPIKKKK
jgi:DNA gyrase subunit A